MMGYVGVSKKAKKKAKSRKKKKKYTMGRY